MLAAIWGVVSFWLYPAAFVIGVPLFLYWYGKSWQKWYDHPDTVAERNKENYEKAHAYTEGKCCCGRIKDEDHHVLLDPAPQGPSTGKG